VIEPSYEPSYMSQARKEKSSSVMNLPLSMKVIRLALVVGICSLLLSMVALAQQTSDGPLINLDYGAADAARTSNGASDSTTASNITGQSNASQRSLPLARTRDSDADSSTSLSANEIIGIFHDKPEVMVDLKRVMADYFLKHGIAVEENSITDEFFFRNIAANSGLRQTVSLWLRARGYATDADFGESADSSMTSNSLQMQSKELDRTGEEQSLDGMDRLAQSLRDLPEGSELLPRDPSAPPLQRDPSAALLQRDPSAALLQRDPSTGLLLRDPSTTLLGNTMERNEPLIPQRDSETFTKSIRSTVSDAGKRESPSADAIQVVHQSAPYNLQSLRDLYTQVPEQSIKVKRFGSDVFLLRGMATKEMPIDLPIGPDYILGPGDGVTVSLWGSFSQSFTRTVDREGKLLLPEAGPVVVAGLTLERTQVLVQGALSQQFKNARVAVSVAHLRTVRVYVVGDVQRPGAYDISSLSTPLNALYAAGGPTSIGSLRTVRHYRGTTLLCEVDLYDFLRHGVRADGKRLEPGDTILVPATGPQVEVSGMVKRPAIYEFKGETTLSSVLEEAGGLRTSAALTHISIERIEANGHRITANVDLPEGSTLESSSTQMDAFKVRDGDRVIVAPILPYSEKAVYVSGHVVRPGKVPYRDAMKLSDVLRSYQDLLPEPSDHGEIIRLMPPDLRPEAIDFSVVDVLAGNASIHLQPFDTIRIVGRYETDAPRVTVRGEVQRPGAYALTQGMTAAQLVRIAGGFKRSALLDKADLASYEVKDGRQVVSRRSIVPIGQAVEGVDANADVPLKPGDVLSIHQISGWNDIGASVMLMGEVVYPGTYGLQEGETLSSVIRRAGGFRTTAYPDGAVLIRKQVKELEQRSRAELIRKIETTSPGDRLAAGRGAGEDSGTLQVLMQQQNQVLQRLRSQPAVGRLVIKISADIPSWAGTPADIELRSGDVLTVPKRPGFILISGQVYNSSAITYVPGKDAGWYLRRAGGATDLANRKEVFVIRANGLVVGRRSGEWYQDQVLSTRMNPGDVVVVPQKITGGSAVWKNMLATAQVFSSIAFTAVLALR
jgi:protein involved in polysaccharide export with SLBB domain